MKSILLCSLLPFLFSEAALPSSAAEGGDGYLNSKGNFTQNFEVKQLQGGFAGDTGWLVKVDKNGGWKKYQVFNERLTLKAQGMLTSEQRKSLARELAKYKLMQLPRKTGKPTINRQLLVVRYGKHSSQLIFGAGALLPKPNPETIAGRFGGIVRAVSQLTKDKKSMQ